MIFNTATNHDLHHQYNDKVNYGFYFIVWDKLMGTSACSTTKN